MYCVEQSGNVNEIDVPRGSRKIGTAAKGGEACQVEPFLSVHGAGLPDSGTNCQRAMPSLFNIA